MVEEPPELGGGAEAVSASNVSWLDEGRREKIRLGEREREI